MTIPTVPGWYADDTQAGVLRWYDGRGWTAYTAPVPGPAHAYAGQPPSYAGRPPSYAGGPATYAQQPTYVGQSPTYAGQPADHDYVGGWRPAGQPTSDLGPSNVAHWLLPVGRSWQSVTAGYVGLAAVFFWVLGPVAIVLGVLAMRRARTGGHGRGRAIFAIVTGTIASIAGLLFLVDGQLL